MTQRYELRFNVKEKLLLTYLDSEKFLEKHPTLAEKIIDSDNPEYKKAILWDKHRTNTRIELYPDSQTRFADYDILRIVYSSNNSKHSPFCGKIFGHTTEGEEVKHGSILSERYFKMDLAGIKTVDRPLRDFLGPQRKLIEYIDSIRLDCEYPLHGFDDDEIKIYEISLLKTEYEVIPESAKTNLAPFKKMKERWRELLVGKPGGYNRNIKEYTDRLERISDECQQVWDLFKETYTGERDSMFGAAVVEGIRGTEGTISANYRKIEKMAYGYATYGVRQYKNPELLADIKKALDYQYKHYFGKNVKEKGIWGNWWFWYIGNQLYITNTLIMLYDEFSVDDVKRYYEPIDYLVYYPAMGGCNRAWCSNGCFASAILQNDAERLLISIEKTTDLFEYTRNNDGYYEDGSFVQHWFFPYTNGYGRGMYSISAKLPYVLSGTEYEYLPQITENQYRFALENMRYAICGENLTAANAGREICREGRTEKTVGAHVETLALIAQYAEGEKKNRIESEIRYFMKLTGKSFVDNVAFPLMQYITEIYNNEDIVPAEPLKCVKVFGSVDRIFKYGERFSAVVANSSNRICRYEAINNENMTGWYMGDGMLYVYTPDYDFDTDFFNKANRYRMPGTTVNGSERVPKSYTGVWSIFNKYPTACGVSSGDFGLSMFELGYPEPDGDHNLFDTDITARKSNFFFDDEIVCVGTGIKDGSGLPVETVLDNRLVRDTDKLYINGNNVTPTPVGKIEDLTPSKVYPTDTKAVAKDIYFDNMGGYLLEEKSNIRYRIYDNEKKYLEITLPHGENVSDGEYAYTLVPNVSREYFDAYKTAHPVSIECMSNTAHVVKKVAAGAIGYAFYEGGAACGITSSGIAAVMITVEDGELCINLSDPSHTQKNIRLSICLDTVKKLLGINEISEISYVSERTEATLENGVLTIEADVFEEASERHTVKLK